jgi:hypothetical protein
MVRWLMHSCVLVAVLSPSVLATTYTVDDTPGPGVDFNDIPPAIAAAQAGDVLLVAPGSYSSFVLDRGLVIIGFGAQCAAPMEVRNLPAGERAALVGLRSQNLVIDACAGTVLVDSCIQLRSVDISYSPDVRMQRTNVEAALPSLVEAIRVEASRLELDHCDVRGRLGVQSSPGNPAVDGGIAVRLVSGSRLCAMEWTARGGNAVDESTPGAEAGSGGQALWMQSSDAVLLGPGSLLVPGYPGFNWTHKFDCSYDGSAPSPVFGSNWTSSMIESGTTFGLGGGASGVHCIPYENGPSYQCVHTTSVPADPSLEVTGPQTPGSTLTFVVYGEPGASATLNLGRGFVVEATPGVEIERLVPTARVLTLGVIPASGSVSRSIPLPPTFPRGFVFGAQAKVVGSNGLHRTNSAPVIVR